METLRGIFENEFFTGGFVLGVITAIVMTFKSWGAWIWKRVERKLYYAITIEFTDELYNYFEIWLQKYYDKEYRRLIASIGKTVYNPNEASTPNHEDNNGKEDRAKYRQENDLIFIKYRGAFVKIRKTRTELQQTQSLFNLFFDSFTISTLFKRRVLKQLVNEVIEYNQQFKPPVEKSVWVETHDDYGNWCNRKRIVPKTIKQIVLPKDSKSIVLDDIDKFLASKEWYDERAIPYKRGYLFYGSPGNGKTSLVGALAHHTGRTIHVVNLSELKDSSLKHSFNNIDNKSIILIEDIDAIFDGRKSNQEKLTFSNFLQCLDGVISSHDIITIVTTNHINKLDPALLRDGRIDMKIEINNPTSLLVNEYLRLFYNGPAPHQYINGEYKENIPMSAVQNICLKSDSPEEAVTTLLK